MSDLDEIKATYFVECAELMEQLESALLDLEAGRADGETIDAAFRAVHSIKGGAAAFELADLVDFTHRFETVLDRVRSGTLEADATVAAVLLRACDGLGDLVAATREGLVGIVPDLPELDRLGKGDDGATTRPAKPAKPVFEPVAITLDIDQDPDEPAAPLGPWIIELEPLPNFFLTGNEPLHLFRALGVLGSLEVEMMLDALPPLAELDPLRPYARWRIALTPAAPDLTETEIENVFEFVHDLCVVKISSPEAIADLLDPAGSPDDDASPPSTVAPSAAAPERADAAASHRRPATIRVPIDRIDRLVNLVGELVISQSMVSQSVAREDEGARQDAVSRLDELQQLTRQIQDGVMAIRAQPVHSLFQRMSRIVREAAQATGKKVRLVTSGEATEIDKTVVESLSDPLTHMIRNAIDHGIEDVETRRAAGKDPTGTVRLSARQQSDRVIIEVSDDGRGIDRGKVLARAMANGLVTGDRVLDPEEIDRLLFAPGFSTADDVSALSGRGVGLDVVHRAVRDLKGSITVVSDESGGSRMSISLPLTLAILDGMIVRSADQRLVVPIASILETQTLASARVEPLTSDRDVVLLHDRFVPLVHLSRGLGLGPAPVEPDPEEMSLLFLQPDDEAPYALLVDAIESQRQVVVKGLGDGLGRVPCVSAATILGDGRVALILDPSGLNDQPAPTAHSLAEGRPQ